MSFLKKKCVFCFFIILYTLSSDLCYSQTLIKGKVLDTLGNPISNANVFVKPLQSKAVLDFKITNLKGEYELSLSKAGNYSLNISHLSYNKKEITLKIDSLSAQEIIIENIILKEQSYIINEIVLNSSLPINIKKDTITFKTSYFLKGHEETVEDLLKNIPGLNIDSEGKIKYGNQEIEKVMVDGDDFFEKGYKILTKNMPSDPIDKVEILKKYSNNKLLKGIENSDKIALNLKLKDKVKRVWFGNINTGYNLEGNNRYSIKGNLMNFGKKNKYYLLTNLNNIGYDATGDIWNLIYPFRYNEPGSLGDDQNINSLIDLNSFIPNFKQSRANFNNSELLSINNILSVTDKVKLKTLGFFNWDENDFFRNSTQAFTTPTSSFENIENYELRKNKFIGFGKIEVNYDVSKNKTIQSITKYKNQQNKDISDLNFNNQNTIENLNSTGELLDQKIVYTNRFKNKKVLILTGRFIDEKNPQTYKINQFLYQDLFPNAPNTVNNVEQSSNNQMKFTGIEAHLLNRNKNGNLFELKSGYQLREDKLLSSFFLKLDNDVIETPFNYQNNISYKKNDLYLSSKYRVKIDNFGITGEFNLHNFNNSSNVNSTSNQNVFFINPKIGWDWKINKKNTIFSTYSYNTKNANIFQLYNNYILTGFRKFERGAGSFNQVNQSSLSLNYRLGNWSDKFFAHISLLYSKDHDFFSTNSFIAQNYNLSDKIVIKDRDLINISSNIDRYIKSILSNVKLIFGFSDSNYKNIVNNSNLREVNSINYNYGLELRSGFKGIFNYHIGTKWFSNKIKTTINNSFTNNNSFLDMSFTFSNDFNIELQTERYFFGNLNRDNTYYFADLNLKYVIKKNKLNLFFSGKNLFNTERFRTFSINDVSTYTTEYRLLPRFLLLRLEYKF